MARTHQSEFHKRLQATAYNTLKVKACREAITMAIGPFRLSDAEDWEALCAIRDHVNALIGAHIDVDAVHRKTIVERAKSGEFNGKPQEAIDLLNSNPKNSITDIYAEVDWQGIPE
jgi:hypothetical protein